MGSRAHMGSYVTRLIPLRHLRTEQWAQCEALRRETGRCWSDLVTAHREARERGHWMTGRELELLVARGYALHSQTVQALAQRLDANVQTARALREQEAGAGAPILSALPYKTPEYHTVIWKDMAIRVEQGHLLLSNGRGRSPLRIALPAEYHQVDIRKAELTWRADHFELCLIISMDETAPDPRPGRHVAGVDLGEVHIAALVTSGGGALLISGRHLRACKRLRNKRHAAYQARLARCQKGSRRWRHLRRSRARASARFMRQQRDILHQASRKALTFAAREDVTQLAVGDVREIGHHVRRGKNNQKISQWAHGQFYTYLEYKARSAGISVTYIAEDFSTVTCSGCGYQRARAPQQRFLVCACCGQFIHRDVNGAANICSRAHCGVYGRVHVTAITCQRPITLKPKGLGSRKRAH